MIDLHCHILPGIDDGPPTVEEAVSLARAVVAAGTTVVAATPHVSARYPENSAARISGAVAELNERLAHEGVPLLVVVGAEVAVAHATDLDDDELRRLCLGTGPWLLAECPYAETSDEFEFRLRSLAHRGFRVLLAHPERISAFHHDHRLLRQLVDLGMRCQLTASSLAGRFGRTVQRYSWSLVEQDLVHVVSSDAHAVDRRRPEIRGHLETQRVHPEWIRWWTQDAPAAILSGDPPPAAPACPPRRSRMPSRLRGR